MIGIELERGLSLLFLAQAVEAFDGRMAVRAILPFARRAPPELRGGRSLGESIACVEQSLDVDAIVGGGAVSHDVPPLVASRSIQYSFGGLIGGILTFLSRNSLV